MPIRPPSADELIQGARAHHFELSPEEIAAYGRYIAATLTAFDRLDELVEPKLPVDRPRAVGWRPTAEENPYGAWAWRCSIKGEKEGALAGRTVAIKDNVAVAGVPLLNGSALMQGFIPDVDATVVTRLLDAGAEIVGKATCEAFCFSGGSTTSSRNRYATRTT